MVLKEDLDLRNTFLTILSEAVVTNLLLTKLANHDGEETHASVGLDQH